MGLSFDVDREAVAALIQKAGNKATGTVSEHDFLCIARMVRETEAARILAAVRKHDTDRDGTVTARELPDIFRELGYMVTSPDVIVEAMVSIGWGRDQDREMAFEDLCPVLDHIREVEGFPQSEVEEIMRVFKQYDTDES